MFIFRFLCFFTFCQHKQLPMVAQFFKGYASLEVKQPREVATDLTSLTGFFRKIGHRYRFCLLYFQTSQCFWASAPKGAKPCHLITSGCSFHPSIRPSVRMYVCMYVCTSVHMYVRMYPLNVFSIVNTYTFTSFYKSTQLRAFNIF
jgi:hypothetical protein